MAKLIISTCVWEYIGIYHTIFLLLYILDFFLEKEMATHSSILAWRIPGTEEPSGLPSMVSHRVGYDWSDLAAVADSFLDNKFILKGQKSVGAGLGTEHIEDDRTRKEGNQVSWWNHQAVNSTNKQP